LATLVVWPGVIQTVFREPAFVGHEQALMRVIGLTIVVIGWLYFFGGRSGSRQFVTASVVDRLVFVPAVLIPLTVAGVFPHLFLTFAVLDGVLAIGAWGTARARANGVLKDAGGLVDAFLWKQGSQHHR
jgi:hypothetical protein